MRFSMILEMVDKFTGPAKRAKAGVSGLRASVRQMAGQIRGAAADVESGARSIDHFDRRARRLRQVALGRTFQAIGNDARKLGRDLFALERRLKLVERAGNATGRGLRKMGGMAAGLLKSGLFAGGAAVAGAGGFALFDLFSTAGQFEQAESQLSAFLGSARRARAELNWVKNADVGAPIGQLIEGYVTLRKAGIKPTEASLRTIADEARASKMEFGELAKTLKEVRGGDYGGLEALGITISKSKGIATLTFLDKEGKRVSRSVRDSADEMQDAITAVFEGRSSGAASRYRSTFFGLLDGMRDRWSRFQLMVADAGIFDMVKSDLDALLSKVEKMAGDGSLKKWAEDVSNRLEMAWKWGKEFVTGNWDQVVQDMKDIAAAVGLIADGILALRDAANTIQGLSGIVNPLQNPVLRAGVRQLTGQGQPAAPATPRAPARLPSDASPLRQFQKQSSLTIGGKSVVEITTAPGLAARVQSVSAKGSAVPLEVRTGRTMRSAA